MPRASPAFAPVRSAAVLVVLCALVAGASARALTAAAAAAVAAGGAPGAKAAAAGAAAAPTTGAAPTIVAAATPSQVAFLGSKQHAGSYELVVNKPATTGTNATTSLGSETTLGGLPVYLALPAASPDTDDKTNNKGAAAATAAPAPAQPKGAVLLYSDIYGWRGNGTRLWADRLASLGYAALVPDFFQGRSAGNPASPAAAAEDRAWIIALPKQNVTRAAGLVLADLRARYPTLRKTAAYGFCWGGRYAALAVGSAAAGAKADAAVAYHASLLAPEEIAAVSRPILFVNAAGDPMFNETTAAQARAAAAENAKRSPPVAVELKTYEGVRHGFSVRAAPNDTVATAASESAFQDGVAFLKRQGVVP